MIEGATRHVQAQKNDPEKQSAEEPASQDQNVQTGGWDDHVKVRSRQFNGPAGVDEPIRVTFTKDAYADLIGHSKETLNREICGVLLGDLCEDEHGRFISVQTTIRGGAATTAAPMSRSLKKPGTRSMPPRSSVPQTPDRRVVSFPPRLWGGILRSGPFHPEELLRRAGPDRVRLRSSRRRRSHLRNYEGQIVPVQRFWVDGRERRSISRAERSQSQPDAPIGRGSDDLTGSIRNLQDRVRQLTDAVEQQRNSFYGFLTFLGVLAAGCFLAGTAYWIYRSYTRPIQIPEEMQNEFTLPTPIIIDGKPVVVSLSIKKWALSPEIEEQLWQVLFERHKAQEAAAAAATQKAKTATTTSKSTSQPAPSSTSPTPPKPAM